MKACNFTKQKAPAEMLSSEFPKILKIIYFV